MFTHYKLGPHVLELELRPCVLGVLRPTVIKWLKPGWRDKRNEVVRRMDAGSVTPIRLTDDEIAWTPEAVTVRASGGEIIGLDTWGMAKVLTGAYGPDSPGRIPTISPLKSPMCQIKNDAMVMIKHTADAATAPFFLSFSPMIRVAVK